jgi:hypothetical protein
MNFFDDSNKKNSPQLQILRGIRSNESLKSLSKDDQIQQID